MKVRCVSSKGWEYVNRFYRKHWWSKKEKLPVDGPKVGDVITVEREEWYYGQKYYLFVEWPDTGRYHHSLFKPIEESYEKVSFSEIKEKASIN